MDSRKFEIGDIVTLQTHPYFDFLTNVIISGDHVPLPPLMLVIEVFKAKQNVIGSKETIQSFKYKCIWFSAKGYRFVNASISEIDLKLIAKGESTFKIEDVKRGDRVVLRSAGQELGKKRSSLSFEDNTITSNSGLTTINSLLTFLSPVMQVLDITEHKTKQPLTSKLEEGDIRKVHLWDIKCSMYNPTTDRITEITLPFDALEIIEAPSAKRLSTLNQTIEENLYLSVLAPSGQTIIKPRNIANKCGRYFLRGYDYIYNRVFEFEIASSHDFEIEKNPFIAEVPGFNVSVNPKAATPEFITTELANAVIKANVDQCYIRIKYKSRNDQLTFRTLREYKVVTVKEANLDVSYLIGFCMTRQAKRNFRMDRIQNMQQLALKFKMPNTAQEVRSETVIDG